MPLERNSSFHFKTKTIRIANISFRFTVLVTGPLSDRIGRKRLLQILSLTLYIVSAITQLILQFVSMNANTK